MSLTCTNLSELHYCNEAPRPLRISHCFIRPEEILRIVDVNRATFVSVVYAGSEKIAVQLSLAKCTKGHLVNAMDSSFLASHYPATLKYFTN